MNASDYWIRIQEAQKHTDPTAPDSDLDLQHCNRTGSEDLPSLALGERTEDLLDQEPGVQDSVHGTAVESRQRRLCAQRIQTTAHSLNVDCKLKGTVSHEMDLAFDDMYG